MVDVQKSDEVRGVFLNKVGIKNFIKPVILNINNDYKHTVGYFDLNVSLAADKKAIHMSRLIEALNEWNSEISYEYLQEMLNDMKNRLDSEKAELDLKFMYFKDKAAPVSEKVGIMSYDCQIKFTNASSDFELKVEVPITSVCPCSKAISKYGAHNQRGMVEVTVRTNNINHIDDIIKIVDSAASSEVFSLLKRVDEKYVTEAAFENPKFVEDIARDVIVELQKDNKFQWYTVGVENFESIHNHNAYAGAVSQ